MTAMRRMFQDSSFPETNGGLPPAWPIVSSLSPKMVRLIGVFEHCGLDGAGNFVSCALLEGQLSWLKRYSVNPHIVVATTMPEDMTGYAEAWSPSQWARYQDFATKAVRYIAVQYASSGFLQAGFPESMFEVGNQLDITTAQTDMWPFDPANLPPIADPRRFAMELRLFQVWSKAVDVVAKENPTRKIAIAGPGMGPNSTFMTNSFWHVDFVQWAIANNIRLDAVTLHYYGGLEANSGNGPMSLADLGRAIRSALVAGGRAGTQMYMSEWGPSSWTNTGSAWGAEFAKFNYRAGSAAWAASFIRESIRSSFTGGAILLMRDQLGNNTIGSPGVPSLTYFQNGIDFPKPYTNVFSMMMLMPGTRSTLTLPGNQPTIGAVASTGPSGAAVLIYNYKYLFDWNTNTVRDLSSTQAVGATFTNLPFTGRVRAERYLIDIANSNIGTAIDAGTLPVMSKVTLHKEETLNNQPISGKKVQLPRRVLNPSAVTLWVITKV